MQVMFNTDSIFIYFNKTYIRTLGNSCGKNLIYRSKTKCHFNVNLLVLKKQTGAKMNAFSESEGRNICALAIDVKEIIQ